MYRKVGRGDICMIVKKGETEKDGERQSSEGGIHTFFVKKPVYVVLAQTEQTLSSSVVGSKSIPILFFDQFFKLYSNPIPLSFCYILVYMYCYPNRLFYNNASPSIVILSAVLQQYYIYLYYLKPFPLQSAGCYLTVSCPAIL